MALLVCQEEFASSLLPMPLLALEKCLAILATVLVTMLHSSQLLILNCLTKAAFFHL